MRITSPLLPTFLSHPHLPSPPSPNHTSPPTCNLHPRTTSRRAFLTLVSLTPFLLDPPTQAAEPPPQLPPGAREFSRLLSAQKQWAQLVPIFSSQRQLEPSEWDSLRGYLRSIYAVSGDMEFLSKTWNPTLKPRGIGIAKQFRTIVKGMDKPALDQDVQRFSQMHAEATHLLDEFFAVLKEASIGDIPDEL